MHIAKSIDNQGGSHTGASARECRKSSCFVNTNHLDDPQW